MVRKNDFKAEVKKALAHQAGNVCSFPGCNAATSGPSAESSTSISKTGMACHIYAAADGAAARRVRPSNSPIDTTSIENGIWMCYKHGKLIDTDESTYTPELLKDWRRLAKKRASIRHAMGREPKLDEVAQEPLAMASVKLPSLKCLPKIIEVLENSAIEFIWGRSNFHAIRDLAVELFRNALTHGQASYFEIRSAKHSIQLLDNGKDFSINDLRGVPNGQGGYHALSVMEDTAPQLVASCRRDSGVNVVEIFFAGAMKNAIGLNPCSVTLSSTMGAIDEVESFLKSNRSCGTIFVTPDSLYFSFSDAYMILTEMQNLDLEGREIAIGC